MRTATYLIAASLITSGSYLAYGQNEEAKAALRRKLTSQFTLTQVTEDRSAIVKEGTAVLLKKGGMTLSSFNEMPPCSNTVKNGGISTDMFCKLVSMSPDGSPVVRRQAAVDEKLWLIDLRFEKSDVTFLVYSDAIDGVRYYAWLKFPFDKRQGPNPDEVTARIAEVLTVQPANNTVPTDNVALEQPPAPIPPPPQPPPEPPRLPATYVSAQTPADQLQLNADNSFSLQEGGQTYHGTFVVNGNAVELSILETGDKTTATIQGNNLTDSAGQPWVCREQSAGNASGGATLRNEDVIKMAKASFDDAIIIAKISSSKCQFDTSTDALIQLKQSGVSATVLKAMVGAGK